MAIKQGLNFGGTFPGATYEVGLLDDGATGRE